MELERDSELAALALVGSRVRGFNHDTASKLQRLIMAHAEIDDLVPAGSDLRPAVDGLASALDELGALFAELRALAKGGDRAATDLRGLLRAVAQRAGTRAEFEIPELEVSVREPETLQVLALLTEDRQTLAVHGAVNGDRVTLAIACAPSPTAVALANTVAPTTITATGVEISLLISK